MCGLCPMGHLTGFKQTGTEADEQEGRWSGGWLCQSGGSQGIQLRADKGLNSGNGGKCGEEGTGLRKHQDF